MKGQGKRVTKISDRRGRVNVLALVQPRQGEKGARSVPPCAVTGLVTTGWARGARMHLDGVWDGGTPKIAPLSIVTSHAQSQHPLHSKP